MGSDTVNRVEALHDILLLSRFATVQTIHGSLWTDGQRDQSNSFIDGFSSADATRRTKINLADISDPLAGDKCACFWLFTWEFGGSLLVHESIESHDVQYSRSINRTLVFTNFQCD